MAKAKKTLIDMGLFCSAEDALKKEKNKALLPLSPSLDYRLGGGIAEGSLVLIQGKAKCGKSLTCMEAVVNALKQGRKVFYFDSECRLTASKYFIIDGFDILHHPNFKLLNAESSDDNGDLIGGEKMYSMIIQMMKLPKYKGALFIIDSLSDVVTQECLDDPEVSAQRRDQTPKLNADFLKKVKADIRKSNSIVIGVQHLQVDIRPNAHGALKAVGGDRLEYSSDICLLSKHSPLNIDGENINRGFEKGGENIDGLLIQYDLTYNKLLAPYVAKERSEKIQNYYKFGRGCWKAREIIDVLDNLGLLTYGKSGWITFLTDKISDKVQGADKAADIIDENIDYFDRIIKKYYEETYGINYNFVPYQEDDE
jgi:archaellum biogenesis ATPase FlaH